MKSGNVSNALPTTIILINAREPLFVASVLKIIVIKLALTKHLLNVPIVKALTGQLLLLARQGKMSLNK